MLALEFRQQHLLRLIAAFDDQWDRLGKGELAEAGNTVFDLIGASLVDSAVMDDRIGASADRNQANE
jgi:hypothetical protein